MPSDRLFGASLTTDAMGRTVGDEAWLAAMLRFEAALAGAQARLGLIPGEAAAEIRAACDPAAFDVSAIGQAAATSASPVVATVSRLRESVSERAAPFVHRDATSQDVIDTAMMLVARDGVDLAIDYATELARACLRLAEQHRETPMAARTLMRVAEATTFGFKAAMWAQGVMDSRRRLIDVRRERLALQLGGPVGAQADRDLVAAVGHDLGLAVPELSWDTSRGRVLELGSALVQAAAAAGKIAGDLVLMAQDEVGEATFAAAGASSSMPHKRNPARAVEARAACALATVQLSVLVASAAGAEHERAAGAWQAEWPAVSELLRLTAGALARTREALNDLRPETERMRSNLETYAPAPHADRVQAAAQIAGRAIELYRKELRSDRRREDTRHENPA